VGGDRSLRRLAGQEVRLEEDALAGANERSHAAKRLKEANKPFLNGRAAISCNSFQADQMHGAIVGENGEYVKGVRQKLSFTELAELTE
jgi:hypothetical protein